MLIGRFILMHRIPARLLAHKISPYLAVVATKAILKAIDTKHFAVFLCIMMSFFGACNREWVLLKIIVCSFIMLRSPSNQRQSQFFPVLLLLT